MKQLWCTVQCVKVHRVQRRNPSYYLKMWVWRGKGISRGRAASQIYGVVAIQQFLSHWLVYPMTLPLGGGGLLAAHYCSWHGFPYIRGWMQMVLAPNDLFSWKNDTMRYDSMMGMLHYCYTMHNDTHSVHNRLLKPWWGRLPCTQTFSTSSLLPCPNSTDAHCPLLGARAPPPQKWRPHS